jgi:hypothetical protein
MWSWGWNLVGDVAGGVTARGFGALAGTFATTCNHPSPVLPDSGRYSTIADVYDHRSALEEEGRATSQRLASNREWALVDCGAAFKKCAFDAVVDKLKPKVTWGDRREPLPARPSICPGRAPC